jgi:hypothetical protein
MILVKKMLSSTHKMRGRCPFAFPNAQLDFMTLLLNVVAYPSYDIA